jgi:hypothetical protein
MVAWPHIFDRWVQSPGRLTRKSEMIARTFRILLAGLCIAGMGWAIRLGSATVLPTAVAAPATRPQPAPVTQYPVAQLPVTELSGIQLPAAQFPGPQLAGLADRPGRFVGAGSCAAAACHGGRLAREPHKNENFAWKKGTEFSIWIQSDRHAHAFTTLFSRRSQAIVRKLGLNAAHTEKVCLKCHSLAADPVETVAGHASVFADGASCESCHGAAEHWLEPHQRGDWKYRSDVEKFELGFQNTKGILGRTTACLKCHVGSEGRDVNHDLIAAGHPRLYFETTAYLSKVSPHWDSAKDRRDHPVLEARLWTVGQFATADAALGLLKQRASVPPQASSKTPSPWPELAEYACFACHHGLAADSWRQKLDSGKSLGQFRWGTWNFALTEGLVRTREGAVAADALQMELDKLTTQLAQPNVAPAAVAELAGSLQVNFRRWAQAAEQTDYNPNELQRLLDFLVQKSLPEATYDWENSTQLCLALMAITQARREAEKSPDGYSEVNADVLAELQGIRELLRFPAEDGKLRFSSPSDYNQARIDELSDKWQTLRKIIQDK